MMEKKTESRRWLYPMAIILIVFWSLIIGVMNVAVFYVFGVPLFGLLIGIIFLWTADVRLQWKILLTALPIPIFFLTAAFFYQLNKAEPETFLIASDRRGEIRVFYDETCGEPPVHENGRRIYKIPESGILITNFKENKGNISDQNFYLLDKNGRTIWIPRFMWQSFDSVKDNWKYFYSNSSDELTMDSTGVFESFGSPTYWLSKNSFGYIVSDSHYFEKNQKKRFLESEKFAEKAGNLLKECRKNQSK